MDNLPHSTDDSHNADGNDDELSDEQLELLAGYLYDVAVGEEESIQYPGTAMDTAHLRVSADGTVEETSEPRDAPQMLQPGQTPQAGETPDTPSSTRLELTANSPRLTLIRKTDDRITRSLYPVVTDPTDAHPYQITSKDAFQEWVVKATRNPEWLGTRDELRWHLDGEHQNVPALISDIIEEEIVTEETRVVYSPEMLSQQLEVDRSAIHDALELVDQDAIVPVNVARGGLLEDDDVSYAVYYGHTSVVSEGEELQANVKDLTSLDIQMGETIETVRVDVSDLMTAIIQYAYEIPLGIDTLPYLVISPPPEETLTAEYKAFRKREREGNGELPIHPQRFIDDSNAMYDWTEVKNALLEADIEHPEDHEVYVMYLETSELKDTVTIHKADRKFTAEVEYTGETEYKTPEPR